MSLRLRQKTDSLNAAKNATCNGSGRDSLVLLDKVDTILIALKNSILSSLNKLHKSKQRFMVSLVIGRYVFGLSVK